jgi:acetyltransferase-like isoleucine patch superfamily enzyme
MANIKAKHIDIHPSVKIGKNVNIKCDRIKLGEFCIIGDNVTIECRSFEVDSWLFMWHGAQIGRGGCNGPNSNVKIGKGVGIFENAMINPSESVEIGDNCAIASEAQLWTHGAWLDVLQGFPAVFGPIKVGDNVYITPRTVLLPNVTIGNNVVIGNNSVVNRSLPSGCFAAGIPCKVLKENVYPKELNEEELKTMIEDILSDWKVLCEYKGISDGIETIYENGRIFLNQKDLETIYNIDDRTIDGHINDISEDLRDYLRRRGIKIYTDRFFKSI